MVEIVLGALVVIGVFVFWCDVTGLLAGSRATSERRFILLVRIRPRQRNKSLLYPEQHLVNEQITKDIDKSRTRVIAKGKSNEKAILFRGVLFPDVSWKFVQPYENKWDMLPDLSV